MKEIIISNDEAIRCFVTEHLGKMINANEGAVRVLDDGIYVTLTDDFDRTKLWGFSFRDK